MKVFVTGASGFIGTAVVQELLAAGHEVTGLARTEQSAKAIAAAGAAVLKGSLNDIERLQQGTAEADGVIHTAFIHDFNQYAAAAATDKAAIEAMGEVLKGTNKSIVVTGGILGLPKTNGIVTEADAAPAVPRASETTAIALAEAGVNASVIRLPPSVHDKGDHGFIPFIIGQARKHGVSAYVDEGTNRWPAVHRLDAAQLFRLALEKAAKGARYNAIGEQGLLIRDIAATIGQQLNLPVASISQQQAASHFEWMSRFIVFDNPATSATTQAQLGWQPTHMGLLEDMVRNYF
ncbi:MAG: SDR family oxidoreductase [Agriterribacter sp.]